MRSKAFLILASITDKGSSRMVLLRLGDVMPETTTNECNKDPCRIVPHLPRPHRSRSRVWRAYLARSHPAPFMEGGIETGRQPFKTSHSNGA